jgi:hypothetical protein
MLPRILTLWLLPAEVSFPIMMTWPICELISLLLANEASTKVNSLSFSISSLT